MKVVHISTSDLAGGAAIACKRIVDAQSSNSIDASLLVQKKISSDPRVYSTTRNLFSKLHYNLRLLFDEGYIRLLTNQSRGRFSNPAFGIDISNNPLIKASDIINLHWVNGGFLSLNALKKIGNLGKPIVWTLHDMWAFTGGCHYSLDCRKFESYCSNCPSLKFSGNKDHSYSVFKDKRFFSDVNLTIVTCSKWLKQEAEKSTLLTKKKVINIPNPIDTDLYKPQDVTQSRKKLGLIEDKIFILFGSMNLVDERKGFKYLIESLIRLASDSPDTKKIIEILVFGKANGRIFSDVPYQIHYFGNLKSEAEIISCYNSADIFLAPSLQDNLPNTVLESLSCGTPVIAYNVGGLPDMVDHLKNGYLARVSSVEDLTNGIKWYLNNRSDSGSLRFTARDKVIKFFSKEIAAVKYRELYENLIKY